MTDQNAENDFSHLGDLVDILEHPEKRILPLLFPSKEEVVIENRKDTRAELVKISQQIFKNIEDLSKSYHQLTAKNKTDEENASSSLSGLAEMYVPPGDEVDAETMWGQVELQNKALKKLLKRSMKKLAKSPENIVVLDMDMLMSSDEEESEEGESDEADTDNTEAEQEEEKVEYSDEDEEEDEDEEAKRIRERMERAMEDMESDDGGEDRSGDTNGRGDKKSISRLEKQEEDLIDPVAEELKDGFFDLNEMEDFADEEEDYLPDEAFGQAENKKKKGEKKKKSFHQKQREGAFLNGEDDEDDDDFEDMYESEEDEPVKRKKYREDDEIDALFTMYQAPKHAMGDDADDDDIINMTAADLFGEPNKKYYNKYYKNRKSREEKEAPKEDDDSWGEYDFEKEDQASGWNDKNGDDDKEDSAENEDDSDDDDDDDDDEEGEEESSEDEEEIKSTKKSEDNSEYAKQTDKLRQQTEKLEAELLAEKPWQMTGETKSTSRPVNSLLEGTPEFEMASKQAPTITVEHTASLEEIIKKRILDEDWDDVVPRELPDVGWHKKRGEVPEVSQEKSKLGLGELYEREYLKKAVGYDVDATEKQTEEEKAKDEMKQLFANLCSKLDALSNYHFAPRPIADEAEVRPVTAPAIAMEEVLPLHVSDARGVAPEEVYATKRGREGILRADSEMDQVSFRVCIV